MAPAERPRKIRMAKPPGMARRLANTSCFVPEVAERIARDWLRGISERSLSATYERTREAIEQTVRAQVLMMLARKSAYAVSLMLAGLCGWDAWEYTRVDDGGASVQRAFRARKVKRGRREGDVADSVWATTPEWGKVV